MINRGDTLVQGIKNFSLAERVLIQMIRTITPPKNTNTRRYKNHELINIVASAPIIRAQKIKINPNEIG